jgi:predicted porin
MNKKLVAVAIAGLLAAPLAQAQTANVTLYGRVSLDVLAANYSGPTTDKTIGKVDSISSRWGLRGSEALGKGMNAIFQCETPLAADEGSAGTSVMCGREGWVGLNGGWGEAKLGYGLTPYDDVKGFTDHQGSNGYENPNNGVSSGPGFATFGLFTNFGNQGTTNSGAFDARYGNSISYKTPNFKGFTLRTQYAFIGETTGDNAFGWDTALIYANGPATFGVTYAYHGDFTGLGGGILGNNDQDAWRVAGKWNFGPVIVDGYFDQAQYKFSQSLPGTFADLPSKFKYRNWAIGALVPFGAWTFGAQYNNRNNGLATAYNGNTNSYSPGYQNLRFWGEGGGDHYALTADYALSKRTTVRMYWAQMTNEGTLTSQTATSLAGDSSVWALSAGLWHTF